ncbi:MAG: mii [Rhodoferax sp.]|nr:mii [Rhodoferax sp.]
MHTHTHTHTPQAGSEQLAIKTVLMRGGSSKAVFLDEANLPRDQAARDRLILALFGSPDKRQIDGLGGSDYLTSKCAIIGPPTLAGADVDYTIAQVSVEHPLVSYDTNCGNISAAVGHYAIEEGIVDAVAPWTLVRVHNVNTGKILRIRVPVANGQPVIEGDLHIDGVPGTGAEVQMDFSLTRGACTGRLLPTGHASDFVELATLGRRVEISVVDVANPCVFVRAGDLGLSGYEAPGTLTAAQLAALDEIRVKAGALAGIASYLLPFQVSVAPPAGYTEFLTGGTVPADDFDLAAHLFVEHIMHKAYAGTGATCLAVAARITGTVVHAVCRPRGLRDPIRIGHPSGVLGIVADVVPDGSDWTINEVMFSRTARRLMQGTAYVRRARL